MKKATSATIFEDERIKILRAGGFVFTEARHKPICRYEPHYHQHATVMFVLNGSFTERVANKDWECGPQALLVKPPGEPHSDLSGKKGAHSLTIEVPADRSESINRVSAILTRVACFREGSYPSLVMRIFRELRMGKYASSLILEGLALEVLGELSPEKSVAERTTFPDSLKTIKEYLQDNFSRRIELSRLSAVVGLHPAHIARMFRRHFHTSIGDYVRELRISYAQDRMLHSDMSLVEIALNAGFYDQSHFNHTFKRYVGMTPTEFSTMVGLGDQTSRNSNN